MHRQAPLITLGWLEIDLAGYEVRVEGSPVELTLTQFRILAALARRPGWVHDAYQLARTLDGSQTELNAASLKNHMYQLRRKLGRASQQLQTVRGMGYRLLENDPNHLPTHPTLETN
jgi:two-component system phosphate regulon response regulator PhoB